MSNIRQRTEQFVSYVSTLNGNEKGEAQVFIDRLFQAFGHKGFKEAGANRWPVVFICRILVGPILLLDKTCSGK